MRAKWLCFGLGYTAQRLAAQLLKKGLNVAGTSRDPAKRRFPGIHVFPFDRNTPLPSEAFSGVTHVLTSIVPDEKGDPVLDLHRHDLKNCGMEWSGYLGTTAVYGDRQGGWVDEETRTSPGLARAQRRDLAEKNWLESGLPVHIFRLAGIYGPGRNPLENLKNGTARRIVKEGQVFSRIHVDDIVQTLLASIRRPNPGSIYNVCDDEPAPPQDVVSHAAELLGLAPPPEQPYETADLSPMARTFYMDNRRVSNARIKEELGVKLIHPTYREGLQSLLGS